MGYGGAMILEVRHLRVLEAIEREGGVSRAARRLHLTQPAVSHALRDLERRLGVQLFLRTSKGMVATAAGERLLRSAGVVLNELAAAERDLAASQAGHLGVLRLATQCYSCYHWLPGVLKLFMRDFPRVEVQIVPEAARRTIVALLAGEIDLGIVTAEAEEPGVCTEPLFTDEMVAIMNPEHALADRHHLEAEDFADEHVVAHTDCATSFLFVQLLNPAGVTPRRVTEFPLTEAVVETVKAGLGISAMARWAVGPRLAAGTLRAVRLTAEGIRPTWRAAMLESATQSEVLRELVYHLRCCAFSGQP